MNSGTIPPIVQLKLEQVRQELEKFNSQNILQDIKPAKDGRVVKYSDSERNCLSLKIKFSPPMIKILSVHGKWKSARSCLEKIVQSNGRL